MSSITTSLGVFHSYDLSHKNKPIKAIIDVYEVIALFADAFTLKTSEKIPLIDRQGMAIILFITDGCFSICHEKNHLHIATMLAPSIVGLLNENNLDDNAKADFLHYVYAETNCSGCILPMTLFVEKCNEYNLWCSVAQILAHRGMTMSVREKELVGHDAYSKVCSLLMEVWLYPTEIRDKIKIAAFIKHRTHISRSRIMEILATLKNNHFIEVSSGILIYIHKPLL